MWKKLPLWMVTLMIGSGVLLTGCSDDDDDDDDDSGTNPPVVVDQFDTIQAAIEVYTDSSIPPTIEAQDVFDNINDGNEANDPVIVSVRSATHFAIGHVPGAINIPWRDIAESASLALLPTDKDIVVYCYTGHTGAVATTALRALGYDAVNMKWGIMAWTTDPDVRVLAAFDETVDAHDYPTETTVNTPTTTYPLPDPDYTTSQDLTEIVRAAADAYAGGSTPPTITAQEVLDKINDTEQEGTFQIVSVRSEAHYGLGHIPGAICIPWREIADVDHLEKLDPNKQVIVYCYTGHTGGIATTALNMLGYNAVNMKFGITAWTTDTTVRVAAAFDETLHAHDFTIEEE